LGISFDIRPLISHWVSFLIYGLWFPIWYLQAFLGIINLIFIE
jgi:hypothetical protein